MIAAGSYVVLQHPGSGPSSTSGAGIRAGGRAAAAPASGPVTSGPALRYSSDGRAESFMPVSSSSNFVPASLTTQVTSTLAQLRVRAPGLSPSATSGQASPAVGAGPAGSVPAHSASLAGGRFGGILVGVLEGCVGRIAGGHQVLLVDIARYLGGPATLIVVGESGPGAAHLWVVGPACSGSASDVLAQRDLPRG